MYLLLYGLLYVGAACGFYSYLIKTAQLSPEEPANPMLSEDRIWTEALVAHTPRILGRI